MKTKREDMSEDVSFLFLFLSGVFLFLETCLDKIRISIIYS